MANAALDPEKVNKWWKVFKTIIEVILAALTGAVTATTARAAGFLDAVSSVF